ncbi:hypothetical protein LTS17_012005 [Exophiala oligosperma]
MVRGQEIVVVDMGEKIPAISGSSSHCEHAAFTESTAVENFEELKYVRQGLKQRHIQMIALAGTIGTGLFLGLGQALAKAGPLGTFLGYSITGSVACAVVMAVGEMGALLPLSGGYVRYSEYFFDRSASFAQGWNMVYSYLVAIPAELVAAAVLVEFWSSLNPAVWITVFGIIMLISTLVFVRVYGELEFAFALLKIALIIGINILALVITCGGGPSGESIGFRYWREPGPFVQFLGIPGATGRFAGFWTTFTNALYAYASIESISLAAAETRHPRRAIPMAAKRIFARVLLFYVLTIFMVGLVVPSNDPDLLHSNGNASQSPFVIAARRAGIKVVPSIINAVVLTSAWSAGNSGLLGGSRVLYGLALHENAPQIFRRVNRFGIPYVAVGLFGLFMGLGYMTLSRSASVVFGWLLDLVAIATLVNWIIITTTFLRLFYAMKKQNIDRHDRLPWASPFQPYLSWYALAMQLLILLTGGYTTFIKGHWDAEVFVAAYLNVPLVLVLYFGHKFVMKTKIIPLAEVQIADLLAIYEAHPEPPAVRKKGLARLNFLWG